MRSSAGLGGVACKQRGVSEIFDVPRPKRATDMHPAMKPVMVVAVSTPSDPQESKASMSPLHSRECPPNAAWLDGNRNGWLAWAPWLRGKPSRPGRSLVCSVPTFSRGKPGLGRKRLGVHCSAGCSCTAEVRRSQPPATRATASQPAGRKQPRPSTFPRLMGRGSRGKGQGAP